MGEPLDLLGLAPFACLLLVHPLFRLPLRHLFARLDRAALFLHRDPEALLTALAKLRRLDRLPLVAGEEADQQAGPAAEWPRLADLADRAGIPPDRLQEILDGPGSGADRYAPLGPSILPPAADQADPHVFSTAFKKRQLRWWLGT